MILRTAKAALLATSIGAFIVSSNVVSSAYTVVSGCEAELANVASAIDNTTFLGNNADGNEANLVAKLGAAQEKAAAGKTLDAIVKLQDVAATADAWANAAKPKLESAGAIDAAVDGAIACLSAM